MKYRVTLQRTTVEYAYVVVEAENEDAACETVLGKAKSFELSSIGVRPDDWQLDDETFEIDDWQDEE